MFYHGTSLRALIGIAESGLTPTEPPSGGIWPEYDDEDEDDFDPEWVEPRVFMTENIDYAREYAGRYGVILAIETETDVGTTYADNGETEHVYATEVIPASDIRVVCPETGELMEIPAYLSDPRIIPSELYMCVSVEDAEIISADGVLPRLPEDGDTWPEFWNGTDTPSEAREPRVIGYLTPKIAEEMAGEADGETVTLKILPKFGCVKKNDATGQSNGMANQLYTTGLISPDKVLVLTGPLSQSLSDWMRWRIKDKNERLIASGSKGPSL